MVKKKLKKKKRKGHIFYYIPIATILDCEPN